MLQNRPCALARQVLHPAPYLSPLCGSLPWKGLSLLRMPRFCGFGRGGQGRCRRRCRHRRRRRITLATVWFDADRVNHSNDGTSRIK